MIADGRTTDMQTMPIYKTHYFGSALPRVPSVTEPKWAIHFPGSVPAHHLFNGLREETGSKRNSCLTHDRFFLKKAQLSAVEEAAGGNRGRQR
jgi:hypothetical protein